VREKLPPLQDVSVGRKTCVFISHHLTGVGHNEPSTFSETKEHMATNIKEVQDKNSTKHLTKSII